MVAGRRLGVPRDLRPAVNLHRGQGLKGDTGAHRPRSNHFGSSTPEKPNSLADAFRDFAICISFPNEETRMKPRKLHISEKAYGLTMVKLGHTSVRLLILVAQREHGWIRTIRLCERPDARAVPDILLPSLEEAKFNGLCTADDVFSDGDSERAYTARQCAGQRNWMLRQLAKEEWPEIRGPQASWIMPLQNQICLI